LRYRRSVEPLKKQKAPESRLSPVSPPSSPPRTSFIWQGYLAKGGVTICRAKATALGGKSLQEITCELPIKIFYNSDRTNGLPDILDVKNRTPIDTLSSSIKPESSTILCFTFDRDQDKKPFLELNAYFKNNNRVCAHASVTDKKGWNCNMFRL
jgi:hypothetical protein